MAVVNCYLPDDLKERALHELPPGVSFSQLLRLAILDVLGQHPAHRPEARLVDDAGCAGASASVPPRASIDGGR